MKNLPRTLLSSYSVLTRRLFVRRQILPLHLTRSAIRRTWRFFWNFQQVNRFAFIKIHRASLCHYITTELNVSVGKTRLYRCQLCWRKIFRQFSGIGSTEERLPRPHSKLFHRRRVTYNVLPGNRPGFPGRLHSCLQLGVFTCFVWRDYLRLWHKWQSCQNNYKSHHL